jgi:hypothetical protein
MTLGLIQPLIGMSTRKSAGCKTQPANKAHNLNAICEPTASKIWDPQYLTILKAFMASNRDRFTFCAVGRQYAFVQDSYRAETVYQSFKFSLSQEHIMNIPEDAILHSHRLENLKS